MLNINKNKRNEIILRSVLNFYKNEFDNIISTSALGWQYFADYDSEFLTKAMSSNIQNSLNTKDEIEILSNKTTPDIMSYDAKNLIQYFLFQRNLTITQY